MDVIEKKNDESQARIVQLEQLNEKYQSESMKLELGFKEWKDKAMKVSGTGAALDGPLPFLISRLGARPVQATVRYENAEQEATKLREEVRALQEQHEIARKQAQAEALKFEALKVACENRASALVEYNEDVYGTHTG